MNSIKLLDGTEWPLNTAYLGDCLSFMGNLPDKCIDLVLTDPPYGIKRFKKGSLRFASDVKHKDGLKWDKKPDQIIFDEIFRISKYQIIWGSNNFTLPQSEYFIVWDKQQTVENFASAELAYTNIKKPAQIFHHGIHKEMSKEKIHPTMKPLKLIKWCLEKYAPENALVFDPFLGSFTTAVACHHYGLNWIGCEKDADYFKAGAERYKKESEQTFLDF